MVIRTTVVMATLMIVIIEIIRVILIVEMIMDCHGTSLKNNLDKTGPPISFHKQL